MQNVAKLGHTGCHFHN